MSRRKKYAKVERERISELIDKIDNLWILGQIYTFIVNMTRDGDEERNAKKGGA